MVTEPPTVKRATTLAAGCPAASVTVAVTVCVVPAGSLADAGLSVSVAGAPTSSLVTNASLEPPSVGSGAPTVVG